jgi:hypothetical protein
MVMKNTLRCLLLVAALLLGGSAHAQAISNTQFGIPITDSTAAYACFAADGTTTPVVVPDPVLDGCYAATENGSASLYTHSYTTLTVVINPPVPASQSVRVDFGDVSSSPTQGFACVISAGQNSCTATGTVNAASGDVLFVNFINSVGTSSFTLTSATWGVQ